MESGLVSVIIPTYNRFESCCKAIESVLAQTYPHFEILVIDDASTDPVYDNNVLESYPKTTVLHLERNSREFHKVTCANGAVRDIGIQLAKGEWIAFLDDDDLWLPNKLHTQLTELQGAPNVLFCATNYYRSSNPSVAAIDEGANHLTFNIGKCFTSTVLLHTSIVQNLGSHKLGDGEDYDYWGRATYLTPLLFLCTPLAVFNDTGSVRHYGET